MNKSIGQHFRDYLAETDLGKCFSPNPYDVFGYKFATSIVRCSELREIKESHSGLLLDAAEAMVREDIERFAVYLSNHGISGYERETLINVTASELGVNYPVLDEYVRKILEWRREELFEPHRHTFETADGNIIEHPMMTFHRESCTLEIYFSRKSIAKCDKLMAGRFQGTSATLHSGCVAWDKNTNIWVLKNAA